MANLPVLLFIAAVASLSLFAFLRAQRQYKFSKVLIRNQQQQLVGGGNRQRTEESLRLLEKLFANPTAAMQIIVSLIIVAAALYIVLTSKYSLQEKPWAYMSLGAILGYWLNSK